MWSEVVGDAVVAGAVLGFHGRSGHPVQPKSVRHRLHRCSSAAMPRRGRSTTSRSQPRSSSRSSERCLSASAFCVIRVIPVYRSASPGTSSRFPAGAWVPERLSSTLRSLLKCFNSDGTAPYVPDTGRCRRGRAWSCRRRVQVYLFELPCPARSRERRPVGRHSTDGALSSPAAGVKRSNSAIQPSRPQPFAALQKQSKVNDA